MSTSDDVVAPPQPPRDPGEGRYCIDCYYALKGLESPGRCPECGRAFDLADIYSYTFETQPPTLRQRAFSQRSLALLGVAVLEGVAYWLHEQDGLCVMVPFFPVWMFAVIWLMFVVLGLDRLEDQPTACAIAGAVIGGLAFLLFGLSPMIFFGVFCGAVCGIYIAHLRLVGWFD
jgi:hypothetical protein